MPRRPRIKPEVATACYQAWAAKRASILNRSVTIKNVFENDVPMFLARWDQKDWPRLSWFTKRIKYEWESDSLPEPLGPDPIVGHWDEKWWKSPRQIFVLTTLYDQASLAFSWHRSDASWLDEQPREFVGFTDRVCKWALKLSDFFDLNVSRECYLLILIANFFAYEEREKQIHAGDGRTLSSTYSISLSHDQLVSWQRHKMGHDPPKGADGVYFWQVDDEQLQSAVVSVGSEGQVLLLSNVDGRPGILVIIE